MSEIFRKHYSYGETIPILETHVGLTTDIYEDSEKQSPAGPYLKAVLLAFAGPIKSLPMIVEPLQDGNSKVVHLTNIPVPIPFVKTVDMSLISDIVNYRWTPSPEAVQQRENGVVTFDLRLRAAFSVLGRSFTLALDQRPCSITLTKPLVAGVPFQFKAAMGSPTSGTTGELNPQTQTMQTGGYRSEERATTTGVVDGGTESATMFTSQLDIEERLRELGTRILAKT
ncbi:MAG: hypothetical protein KGN02_11490 [bacterium]|nr:hypothetical protein [bacterium]